jgi:hypothetical protein
MPDTLYLLQHVDGYYACEDEPNHWTRASNISQATKYTKDKADLILGNNIKKVTRDQWRVVPYNVLVKLPTQPSNKEVSNILNDAKVVVEIFQKYYPRFNKLSKELSDIEKELLDIDHFTECCKKLNASQGYRVYARQRELLIQRRRIKKEKDAIGYLINASQEDIVEGNNLAKIAALDGDTYYRPRILTELFTSKDKL